MAVVDGGRRTEMGAVSARRPSPRPARRGPQPQTVASYIAAFSPMPSWPRLSHWPPDVFALANLVLDHTEAYRFAVAPPLGRRWPPDPEWNRQIEDAAAAWRESAARPGSGPPDLVTRQWRVVAERRDVPLRELRRGEESRVWEALLTLHAVADEACRGLSTPGPPGPHAAFERRAWEMLARHGSLSRIDSGRIKVTPKTHFATRGITIRSFSRYLALNYESVELLWRRIETELSSRWRSGRRRAYNLLLLPWPLEIPAEAFRPVEGPIENMDPTAFGFFEFAPPAATDVDLFEQVVRASLQRVRRIDAVVMPEAAIEAAEVPALEEVLDRYGVISLIAGVRAPGGDGMLGRNYVHVGVRTDSDWERFEQDKHHRWCLDGAQIRQYHLCRRLDPSRQWWEAIDLPARTMQVIDVGGGVTTASLICEDLARLDEVADLLRRIGPSLVFGLLLDGPQLAARWPSRYAAVLADEPGSTVLTLTSVGMATRSIPQGMRRSRAVALWGDPVTGVRQLELERGSVGLLISASVGMKTVWTADGRRHERATPEVVLSDVHQLRAPAPVAGGSVSVG